ncbi:transglycosylase SLT domain-containing protein [Billgrantia lactosivorans]|uniref:transglycosylase SLT domain-containing protein n=1 Tax=Billgrantia lactosivorans TaxID=2185141 RepID=UPI000DABD436|nr:transglycosylase SLT domain-containing protein [Halomonas lactosivorans]
MLRLWCCYLGLWFVLAAIPVSATAGNDIPEAYVVAAQRHGVPPEVLYAVALTESKVPLAHTLRPWPWTLNVAGQSYYFETRAEACEALTRALFETELIDVGVAQLNLRWQPQLFGAGNRFVDPCDALDPYANLDEAAKLLRSHYDASGSQDWVAAAGRYHRPAGGAPASRYRRAVAANLERLDDGTRQVDAAGGVQFASAENISLSTASSSTATAVEPEPLNADTSLVWVAPLKPAQWVDPERRWDRLVASVAAH